MLLVDQTTRDEVLEAEGNIVISASAGTGKTYTTIQRILKDSNENTGYKTFAAITFTRKAAKEIQVRLGSSSFDSFVGTNDNFILYEIINPFMYDAYGDDYKKEIKPDYSDSKRIRTFEEGIDKIDSSDLMCKYFNKKNNFAFELAYNILLNSKAARRYLQSKYYRIYIDEYQDSDKDMNKLFMYICEILSIPLFIVGDQKQSIYGWRGAYCTGFINLFTHQEFTKFKLWHNFRSNVPIQNYSNIFMSDVRENVVETKVNNEVISYRYLEQSSAINYVKRWINLETKCSILHRSNDNAKIWAENLAANGMEFVYVPTPALEYSNIESEHIWIARSLASYILKVRYSEFDFFSEIPMPEGYEIKVLRKLLKDVNRRKGNKNSFLKICKKIYEYFGYNTDDDKVISEINILFEVIGDESFIPYYNIDKYKLTSGTIHSSKGLEYTQVIMFGNDYNFHIDEDRYLHYVAVSRAEEKLLILVNGFSKNSYYKEIDRVIIAANNINIEINSADLITRKKTHGI